MSLAAAGFGCSLPQETADGPRCQFEASLYPVKRKSTTQSTGTKLRD
jgi:hypothetical protein